MAGRVTASITMSLDGLVAGPGDGPGRGLGEGGERLHNWVFGGPWRYGDVDRPAPVGEDARWLDGVMARNGAVIAGRWTYEAAGHWGGGNPWGVPVFIVTHRPEEEPPGGAFSFVGGLSEAVDRARASAGEKDVHVMGGADVLRQALSAGVVEQLTLIVAPVVLGAGKPLFNGGIELGLEQSGARQSRFATFLDYRIV